MLSSKDTNHNPTKNKLQPFTLRLIMAANQTGLINKFHSSEKKQSVNKSKKNMENINMLINLRIMQNERTKHG